MPLRTRSDVHVTRKQGHLEEVFTQTTLHNLRRSVNLNSLIISFFCVASCPASFAPFENALTMSEVAPFLCGLPFKTKILI